ncbi:hypothetical protein HHI36_010161 [Cryptolaemus montrouzieri]|uniref:Uncharacterized protein n=1 Tax=Cryptolaemus montrouzieri TaxID=559131 RepID=A0ABD2MHZ9_9CUCU
MKSNSIREQFGPYSVFHLNAQSIGTTQHEIEYIVQANNSKFIAITENWKSANQLPAYWIPGYKLVSSFCRREKKHGGAVVYCLGDVECSAREDLTELSVPYLFECAGTEVAIDKNIFVVLSIYCPSTPNYNTFREAEFDSR